jgi:hypothetical protein
MVEAKEEKLCNTYGGTSITGSLVDAVVGVVRVIYDVGKNFGFSIRRLTEGELCPLQ